MLGKTLRAISAFSVNGLINCQIKTLNSLHMGGQHKSIQEVELRFIGNSNEQLKILHLDPTSRSYI